MARSRKARLLSRDLHGGLHNGLVALKCGITAARDLGSVDSLVIDYARQVELGRLAGPRIAAAGQPITVAGGHLAQSGRITSGVPDIRSAVREQISRGARVIKVMATGGISSAGDPGAQQFTLEELTAAVREAHGAGVQIAAHAHAAAGIKLALQAGVDTIEHAAYADEAALAMIVERGKTLVPTVSALNNIAEGRGIPAETVAKSLAARETYRANTAKAIGRGVRIAAGTDAGTALNPIGGLIDELEMYCARGMKPIDAIRSATVHAGSLVSAKLGIIESGWRADLVVVPDDPGDDLAVLREPLEVISRGRLASQSWLNETIEEVAEVVSG